MKYCGGKYKGLSILIMTIFCSFCFSYLKPMDSYSTSSTLTLTVIDKLSLNVSSLNSDGVFATSDTGANNISVSTNNGTGYLLGIKASTEGGNALVNATDSSKTIPSHTISAGVSKTNYNDASYASANNLNNTWGFRPSTYYDTTNNITIDNTSSNLYFPGPSSTTNSFIIDKTTAANATANEYNIALGTRVNSSTAPGRYTNIFVISAVANPTIYSISYNKNTQDTVTNMPTNVVDQPTFDETVNIDNTVPARDGFNFKGWCTTQVADGGTCTGTTYNPDGGGTALTWTLNQTVSSNSLNLYAMWKMLPPGLCTDTVTCMQTMTTCPTTPTTVTDGRDGKTYNVQQLNDGNCWMIENLRLDLVDSTVQGNLTSDTTNAEDSSLAYLKGTATYRNPTSDPNGKYPTAALGYGDSNKYYSVPKISVSGTCYNAYCVDSPASRQWNSEVVTPQTINGNTSIAQGKVGVYYNYCAISAGTYCYGNGTATTGSPTSDPDPSSLKDVKEDICPKGWRLPTSNANGEFKALYTAYNSDYTAFQTALDTPLSGYFTSGTARNQGYGGSFWSSTWFGNNGMRTLNVRSSTVNPSNSGVRSDGLSVRCILDS